MKWLPVGTRFSMGRYPSPLFLFFRRNMKTVDVNKAQGRRLTSVNLTLETWEYLDALCKDAGISRSALIEVIIKDFRENKRSITITIGDKD